jgi:hypothetical protein
MQNILISLIYALSFLLPSKIFAAQGDVPEAQIGKLVSYSSGVLTKKCFYDVVVSGAGRIARAELEDGSILRFYVPVGTTAEERMSIWAPAALRKVGRGEDPTKIYTDYAKTIPRIIDCPETLELIYNELDRNNRLREK